MNCSDPQGNQSRQSAVFQCLAYDLAELKASLADARQSLMKLKTLSSNNSGLMLTRAEFGG